MGFRILSFVRTRECGIDYFSQPFYYRGMLEKPTTGSKKAEAHREKVTRVLREQAAMSPEERRAERERYLEELKQGRVVLTPQEETERREREARDARLPRD